MHDHVNVRRRRASAATAALGAASLTAAAILATAGTASATGHAQHKNGKVTLCHATPPSSAKNGWVQITVSTNAVTHHGHGDHADDIIPAFTYWTKGAQQHYPGKNLDTDFNGTTGQQLLDNGCTAPSAPSSSAGESSPESSSAASSSSASTSAASSIISSGSDRSTTSGAIANGGAGGAGVAGIAVSNAGGNGANAPAGAGASGLAVGNTGDHGSGSSSGLMTAAIVGALLAVLVGIGALALRRRNPGEGA